ncbi:putative 3-isopropylmalate protein [Achaetomium macrosporum]|uniref:3-isopropylmalate dehydrogenase n=1 Tax=Achaetomium macrosporum TaxID=79813 RepID=A0AAN7CJ72_9PEZI|nr:putative 3-isopropylmalate protein [Achaetomium macrosporum]
MSADQPGSSFGDPNAQPPTPKRTPISAVLPSPVFETPKHSQGRFDESGGWTPRFAEEYSVFNATPGNLRGSQTPFPDFGPTIPYSAEPSQQRPLSTEGIGAGIAAHVNEIPPLAPVEPSKILQASPAPLRTPTFDRSGAASQLPRSVERSAKKARRGTTVSEPPGQTATPPRSTRKGERKLAPKLDTTTAMQNDQDFGQQAQFMASAPQQGMGNFVTAQGDVFGYPLSAPATAPAYGTQRSFWDPDPSLAGMDIDFGANGGGVFQPPTSHQTAGPVDWAGTSQMLQSQNGLAGHGNGHASAGDGQASLVSQSPMSMLVTSSADHSLFAVSYPTPVEHPFGVSDNGGAVNPGLLFSRPQSASMDTASFNQAIAGPNPSNSAASQASQTDSRGPFAPKTSGRTELRRSASAKDTTPRKPDRTSASSPVKEAGRPGLSRSFSENRGKKTLGRPSLPPLAPRPRSQLVSNAGVNANKPVISQPQRPSGRSSPSKSQHHHRLSSLSSIPETVSPQMRTQATFTIDANGRARVETTVVVDQPPPSVRKRHSAYAAPPRRDHWASSDEDDSSSTDDEPIIIPSRNTSFALPAPPKPAMLHTFHNSQRSISERSSTSYTSFQGASLEDGDSDGETVVNDLTPTRRASGNALSELQKLRETRQKQFYPTERRPRKAGFGIIRGRRTGEKGKMATHNIVVFGGDHCGPEVVAEAIKVLKAIETHSPSAGKFNLQEHLMGGASIKAHNNPLTGEALAAAKSADAVLLGAIGGPEWGPSSPVRPEQGILKLRKELGTYGNLRPCSFASDSLVDSSPLKAEVCRGTDFVVVRELTGGIYFGERTEDDGSGFAVDTEPYSRAEIERIARLAGFLALAKNPPCKVWSLDKANVLATSRLWRKVVTEVFEREFPQLEVSHQLIDSAAMLMVKNPRALNGVVITSNLFGDIISDEASVIPGSIGLLPSASLGGIPDGKSKCNGIYEPIHGSAPDISGKGIVNPVGTILSVAMMLRYSLNLPKEAAAVEAAVKLAIDNGTRTRDIGGSAGTSEMGDAVVAELVKLLKA